MIRYRVASSKDYKAIAQLHAQSWQDNYQSNFEAEYLAGPVFDDRLEVWEKRFEKPNPDQHVILAWSDQELCGFVCIYLNNDEKYGALIDNLHVGRGLQGHGIGKVLMEKARDLILKKEVTQKYFLYVLTDNDAAISFYKKVGGLLDGRELFKNPGGGGASEVYRFIFSQRSKSDE